jgi:enoyl-CoA hydratase/carnithine racemase
MTPELLDAFANASAEARADGEARAVVIRGSGSCFSAGADLKASVQRDDRNRLPHERSFAMYEPFLSVLDIEVPVVACLNGHTVGGGFGLALVCDIRVGNVESKYGANFARLGLHPGMAISYLLPRLIGPQAAAELLFTARLIRGQEAAQLGILARAVAPEQVEAEAMTVASTIARNAPNALRLTKRTFYAGLGWDVRDAALREAYAQAVTIDSAEFEEGSKALLAKRDPKFD